jgi:hypothetical protein
MPIDDLLRRRFDERRPDLDLDDAWHAFDERRRQDERHRHDRRLRALAAVVALIIGAAGVVVVALTRDHRTAPVSTGPSTTTTTTQPTQPDEPARPPRLVPDAWRTLPASPLSPRLGSSAVWTGREMIIAGGGQGAVCEPDGRCGMPEPTPVADGAAYDPATDTWRSIAPAPLAFAKAPTVWAGDVMLVVVRTSGTTGRLYAYDPGADRWERRSEPLEGGVDLDDGDAFFADRRDHGDPVWTGELAVFPRTDNPDGQGDWAYDPATDRWAQLAADPLGCGEDRVMVPVAGSLVLIASPCDEDDPPYQAARFDLAERRWHRLPDVDVWGCGCWFASGDLVVSPTTELRSASGPYLPDDGRSLGGVLDLATETWSELAPVGPVGRAVVDSSRQNYVGPAGDWIAAGERLYAPAAGAWHAVPPAPDSAWDRATVWTGDEIVTWGGTAEGYGSQIATGAAYTPPPAP